MVELLLKKQSNDKFRITVTCGVEKENSQGSSERSSSQAGNKAFIDIFFVYFVTDILHVFFCIATYYMIKTF